MSISYIANALPGPSGAILASRHEERHLKDWILYLNFLQTNLVALLFLSALEEVSKRSSPQVFIHRLL